MDTTQLTFLLYLFLGQGVLLCFWSLLVRLTSREPAADPQSAPPSPQRLLQIVFALYLLLGQAGLLFGWNRLVEAWESAEVVQRADVVITLHFGFMLFVLVLQLLILIGWPLGWQWTRNFWLRLAQVVCIESVAGYAFTDLECPLTTLERDLRGSLRSEQASDSELSDSDLRRAKLHYLEGASPIAKFSHRALFYPFTDQQQQYISGGFASLVLLTWLFVPPRLPIIPRSRDRSSRIPPGNGPGRGSGPGRTDLRIAPSEDG